MRTKAMLSIVGIAICLLLGFAWWAVQWPFVKFMTRGEVR